MTAKKDPCREAFEKWFYRRDERRPEISETGQGYINPTIQLQWMTWQAAWSQRVPEGMVVVPIEPTNEQISAFYKMTDARLLIEPLEHGYRAMIAPFVKGDNHGE